MKRVVSHQYSSGRLMGVSFKPEKRGNVFVGVALVEDDQAKPFEDREDFDVEDVDAAEVPSTFPDDFPLLAPQRAALARAGLDDLEKVEAHDFAKAPVPGIGARSVETIQKYLERRRTPTKDGAKASEQATSSADVPERATAPTATE